MQVLEGSKRRRRNKSDSDHDDEARGRDGAEAETEGPCSPAPADEEVSFHESVEPTAREDVRSQGGGGGGGGEGRRETLKKDGEQEEESEEDEDEVCFIVLGIRKRSSVCGGVSGEAGRRGVGKGSSVRGGEGERESLVETARLQPAEERGRHRIGARGRYKYSTHSLVARHREGRRVGRREGGRVRRRAERKERGRQSCCHAHTFKCRRLHERGGCGGLWREREGERESEGEREREREAGGRGGRGFESG